METKKLKIILFSVALLLIISCGGSKKSNEGTSPGKNTAVKAVSPVDGKVILEIDNKKYTNDDFKKYLQVNFPDMESASSENVISPRLMSRLFDRFVEYKIIAFAADREKVSVTEGEIDKYLVKLQISQQSIDKSAVAEAVKVQKFLYYKINETIEISDAEVQEYYKNNSEEFQKKPEIHLFQILVKDKETAEQIRGTLVNYPEKFEEIARKESISQENEKGGDMGYFEKGTLPKEIEDIVFSLNPNTISPVNQSAYGFHIFKVESKKKGRLLFIEKVKPYIQNKLMAEKERKSSQEFLTKTRLSLTINIKYNELNFSYQKNTTTEGE